VTDPDAILELLRRIEAHLAELVAHVRQAPIEAAPAPADPLEQLRRTCRERGIYVTVGDEVRAVDAAKLLGVKPETLRQDRCYFERIPCRRVGGRALYRLVDLAERLFPSTETSMQPPG
jgi:hypothetical protein